MKKNLLGHETDKFDHYESVTESKEVDDAYDLPEPLTVTVVLKVPKSGAGADDW